MEPKRENERSSGFLTMLVWPSSLGLGGLISFLFSLKRVNPQVLFEWNGWSLVVFVLGTAISWVIVRHVLQPAERRAQMGRFAWFGILITAATGLSFIHALKDIPPSKRLDVTVGCGAAFFFVACALYGFWRLVRFLERHGQPEEQEYHDQSNQTGPDADH